MKTNTPHFERPGHLSRAALLMAMTCFSSCSFRPQLHHSTALGPAALTGEPISKEEATSIICGGAIDPDEIELSADRIAKVFNSSDPNSITILFVTDIGLVERTLGLGEYLERFIDKNPVHPIESMRRGRAQDHADACYLACVLKAFRMAAERGYISAVVNGGDNVQIGVATEFETFTKIVGTILVAGRVQQWEKQWSGTWWETPLAGCSTSNPVRFYQILGNHEVRFLGTFDRSGLLRVPHGCVYDASSFAQMVSTLPPWRKSTAEGTSHSALGEGTCRQGYYRAYQDLPDGKRLLMIMLNTTQGAVKDLATSSSKDVSFYPSIGLDQLEWLRGTLRSAETDPTVAAAIVFGHHPLAEVAICRGPSSIDRKASFGELPGCLAEFSKVRAYLCGHNHSGCTPVVHHGRYELTEYIVPSLMEFPKCFALVTIKRQERTGEYGVSVRYHNLTELVDLSAVPEVRLTDDPFPGAQAWFEGLVLGLQLGTSSPQERLLAAAKICYTDAARDLAAHSSRHFPNCFAPEVASQLCQTYQGSQQIWELLKETGSRQSGRDLSTSWMLVASALQGTPAMAQGQGRIEKMAAGPSGAIHEAAEQTPSLGPGSLAR